MNKTQLTLFDSHHDCFLHYRFSGRHLHGRGQQHARRDHCPLPIRQPSLYRQKICSATRYSTTGPSHSQRACDTESVDSWTRITSSIPCDPREMVQSQLRAIFYLIIVWVFARWVRDTCLDAVTTSVSGLFGGPAVLLSSCITKSCGPTSSFTRHSRSR